MFSFIIRRTLTTLVIVVGAMILLFIAIQLIPGDPATILLGPRATPEIVAQMRSKMWLDKPIYMQLGRFLLNILKGDLGTDVLNYMPVKDLVLQALPHTIILAFSSIFFACLVGIPLGTYAATSRNSILDRITGILSVSMISTPTFLVGLFLLLIFSVFLNWFPAMGAGESGNIYDQLWHLILPVFTLSLGWIGYIARLMRASILEELNEDYIRTARAKGLFERAVIYKHALRGALIPIITVIGMGFGNLLGGAVLIEIIFHRPGLGSIIYNAVETRNYPILQGGLVIAVFLYAISNFLADLSHGYVDPRIRSRRSE